MDVFWKWYDHERRVFRCKIQREKKGHLIYFFNPWHSVVCCSGRFAAFLTKYGYDNIGFLQKIKKINDMRELCVWENVLLFEIWAWEQSIFFRKDTYFLTEYGYETSDSFVKNRIKMGILLTFFQKQNKKERNQLPRYTCLYWYAFLLPKFIFAWITQVIKEVKQYCR